MIDKKDVLTTMLQRGCDREVIELIASMNPVDPNAIVQNWLNTQPVIMTTSEHMDENDVLHPSRQLIAKPIFPINITYAWRPAYLVSESGREWQFTSHKVYAYTPEDQRRLLYTPVSKGDFGI